MTAEAPPAPTDSTDARWRAVARTWGLNENALPMRGAGADWRPHLSVAGGTTTGRGWMELTDPHDTLVGIGLEGLAFTTAKAVADPAAVPFVHDHLLVDAMNGIAFLDGKSITDRLDSGLLRQVLLHDGVRQLTVVAHGDGGHLKLPGLVGCGITLDTERDLADGRPTPGGCVAGVRCQRSPDLNAVVACRDMRVAAVVLIACKAGLLTDALRPSTTNAALAFLEGHSLGVLAPTGLCTSTPAITRGLLALDRPGDAEAVRDYLTDVAAAPFRLLGRPWRLRLTPTPAAGVTVHKVPPGPPGRVAWWTDHTQPLRPGADTCFAGQHLVLPAEARPGCVTIAARGRPLSALTAGWRTLLDLVRLRANQVTAVLDDSSRLDAARHAVEGAVTSVLEQHAAADGHGMAVQIDQPPRTVDDGSREWQHALADALASLIDTTDVLTVLTTGMWAAAATAAGEHCTACVAPLSRTSLADPLSGQEVFRHDCPNCGTTRLQPDTPVHAQLTGDVVEVTGGDTGDLLISCTYKGFPTPAGSRHDLAEGKRVALPVPEGLPAGLLATSKTVRVVLVRGVEVHAWKGRL